MIFYFRRIVQQVIEVDKLGHKQFQIWVTQNIFLLVESLASRGKGRINLL